MLKRLFPALLALLLTVEARACLNEYHTSLSGHMFEVEPSERGPGRPRWRDLAHEASFNQQRLRELASRWQQYHRLADYSDYGVTLVYLGRYAEARRVFEAIERQQPGLYATAANLGTTFELLGQNEQALRWIERAVRLDPYSHQGSEWIHVNILKAKLSGDLSSRRLIGTDFGPWPGPVSALTGPQLVTLRQQLYYQLSERMSFVRAPEPIVGRLLFDLGNIYALTVSLEATDEVYDLAAEYGGGGVLRPARRVFFGLVEMYAEGTLHLLVFLLVVAGSVVFWRRRRKKRRAAARAVVSA